MTEAKSAPTERQFSSWTDASVSRRALVIGAGAVGSAAALAACAGGNPKNDTAPGGSPSGTPRLGGGFRIGIINGGAKGLDAQAGGSGEADYARLYATWETLLEFGDDGKLMSALAESVEADNASQHTVRVRKGVEFHNGKTLTADDVIYSLQRIGTKANGLPGYGTTPIDFANIKKMDDYTLRLPTTAPFSILPETLANWRFSIVPMGYEKFSGDVSTQVGTTAFKLKSFTPGRESVSVRNPNYWREGGHFDSVTITDFSGVTAQVNALLGGQIDAMTKLPAAQMSLVKSRGKKVLVSHPGTGQWLALSMLVDTPPFDDPRVRVAFKLILDRQTVVDQLTSGLGAITNDIFSPTDPAYIGNKLPQRHRDIEQAKSLLKAAGHESLTVDLYTTNDTDGMVAACTIFADQAKDAGVTINVKNIPSDTYWSDRFGKVPFAVDYWSTRPYLVQVAVGKGEDTHWPPKNAQGDQFKKLYNEALAETDAAKRGAVVAQMQRLQYDGDGYIIPFFSPNIDAYAPNVQGLSASDQANNLQQYASGFRNIWFS